MKKSELKIGDKVVFVNYDAKVKVGMGFWYVYYQDKKQVGVAVKRGTTPRPEFFAKDGNLCVYHVIKETDKVQDIKDFLKNAVNKEIQELRNSTVKLTHVEKDNLKKQEFERLKEQIVSTCKNLVKCYEENNDVGVLNRVKTIATIKKQMFEIEISRFSDMEKINRNLNYRIKLLKNLCDEIDDADFEW